MILSNPLLLFLLFLLLLHRRFFLLFSPRVWTQVEAEGGQIRGSQAPQSSIITLNMKGKAHAAAATVTHTPAPPPQSNIFDSESAQAVRDVLRVASA